MFKIFSAFLGLTMMVHTAFAQNTNTVTLTQKNVADLVLKQGPHAKEVTLEYSQYRLAPAQVLSNYDWRIALESGFEHDRLAGVLSSTSPAIPKYERWRSSLALQKPFTTGTTLGLEINRLSQNVEFEGTPLQTPPSDQSLDIAGITIEQSLLGNAFGAADRGNVNSAQLTYEANNILLANQLEEVVLEAVRQFWNAYVAEESHSQALKSRDRYQNLVSAIKRKTSLGYTNPGDLPQVQAEFESRARNVATTEYQKIKLVEDLLVYLGLEPGTKILFSINKDIAPVPDMPFKNAEDLRSVKAQKLKARAAEEALKAAESLVYPYLDFVGNAYTSGVDESSSRSWSNMMDASRDKYYVGLRLRYNFGSGIQRETLTNRQLARELENTVLNRELQETTNSEAQAKRLALTQFDNAASSKRQRDFREKAVQELNRSYTQGRTDISIFITSLNNYYDSEVIYLRALGDYAIALKELQAARDELIPDDVR